MTVSGANILSQVISKGTGLRPIEPHIYSVFQDIETVTPYDTGFRYIYDWVACNPLYNRLIWGYSIAKYASLTHDALRSSKKGNVLDIGCGSLAFTAKPYILYSYRPVVLMDQSLKMLKIAKSRLIKLNGRVPDNMVFLLADALELPFQPDSFQTVISLNLLHCLDDIKKFLTGLKKVLSEKGRMYFTTLVEGKRFADRYLKALANAGKLVSRNIDQLHNVFEETGMSARYELIGNLVFIYY